MVRTLLAVVLLVILPWSAVANGQSQHLFFDDFTGSALGTDWTVVNANPAAYSLANGNLTAQTLPGELTGSFSDYQNLFLIPNLWQGQDFMVTMRVTGFAPTATSQQIDLVGYTDDGTFIKVANAYQDGRVWELSRSGTLCQDAGGAEADTFYLRLVKEGGSYTGQFSLDGSTYTTFADPPAPDFDYLGFVACQGHDQTGPTVPVTIDYFSVDPLTATANAYDFTFTFGQGDTYTGTVIADPSYGYFETYSQVVSAEGGTGTYSINRAVPGYNPVYAGQVDLLTYYDLESLRLYNNPMANLYPNIGTSYLGSESGYIAASGIIPFFFGASTPGDQIQEADPGVAYSFTFTYDYLNPGAGDYYAGMVYTDPDDHTYEPGVVYVVVDEHGVDGAYTFGSGLYFDDSMLFNLCEVRQYYDRETHHLFSQGDNNFFPAAMWALGSEDGYIIALGVPEYAYGSFDHYEADAPEYTATQLGQNTLGWQYNEFGQAAWFGAVPLGTGPSGIGVFLYDGSQVRLISDIFPNNGNETLSLNNAGEVAWAAYDNFSGHFQVYLYSGGAYSQISDPFSEATRPQIDDAGLVYYLQDDGTYDDVYQYDHGVNTLINDPASNCLNVWVTPVGQVAWLTYDGTFYDLWTGAGAPVHVNDADYLNPDPLAVGTSRIINDNGQVVWESVAGVVYLFDGVTSTPISGQYVYIGIMQLNPSGQVAWQGLETGLEDGYQIYLYNGGAPIWVSTASGSNVDLQLNNAGQVVYDGLDGAYRRVFLSDGVSNLVLSEDYVNSVSPYLNDSGQVVWTDYQKVHFYDGGLTYPYSPDTASGVSIEGLTPGGRAFWTSNSDLYQSDWGSIPAGEYTFAYHYASGDTYSGRVYTDLNQAYAVGYRQFVYEESGYYGYYEITGGTLGSDPGLAGYVEVDSYFDVQTGLSAPGAVGLFVNPGYTSLGSESGYFYDYTHPVYAFGFSYDGHREANLPHQYDYVFHYSSGDYYTGRVYASPEDGYYNGYQQTVPDIGYYEIVNAINISSPDSLGQVYVDAYYDHNSGHLYTPVNATGAAGISLLGSESGNIADPGVEAFRFGYDEPTGNFLEADAANAYTYVFTYSGGDYFYGTVYGDAASGYYVGYREDPATFGITLEGGQTGYFELISESYPFEPSLLGLITVAGYHDADSGNTYASPGVNLWVPSSWLPDYPGGFILADADPIRFFGVQDGDATFYEADLGAVAYEFLHINSTDWSLKLPITANNLNDITPVMNDNGQIVWSGYDGSNWEIYLYSDGRTRPLTIGEQGQHNLYPWINNSGQVVWSGYEGQSLNIYLYDLNTGVTQEVTFDAYNDYYPMIDDNGRITWLADTVSYPDNYNHLGPENLTRVMVYDVYPTPAVIEIAANNNTLDGLLNRPVINNSGEIVWSGRDGLTWDIYRYKLIDHTTTRLTFTDSAINPYYNDAGALVYVAYDGLDNEVYLLENGVTTQITDNTYQDGNPVINDQFNQIVWQGTPDTSTEIFAWSYGTIYQVTDNSAADVMPFANAAGQIVWAGIRSGSTYDIILLNAVGDIYGGFVLAPEDGIYYPGQVINTVDEYGRPAIYLIGGATSLGAYNPDGYIPAVDGYLGQVFVEAYFDADSRRGFTPVNNDLPRGGAYLGSEWGAILPGEDPAYQFGGPGGLEADVLGIAYSFDYVYGNGDLYSGVVVAGPDRNYQPGWRQAVTDELGGGGYYRITGVNTYLPDASQNGQVSVSSYYDTDTAATYTPAHAGDAVGTNYLGSEADWIIAAGVPQYYFGKGFYEAVGPTRLTGGYSGDAGSFLYYPVAESLLSEDGPAMNGLGQIVYTVFDGHDDEIYLNDNGTVLQLTDNAYDDIAPRIWNNRQVVWTGYDGTDWEIFLYNNAPTVQLTNNDYDDGHTAYTFSPMFDHVYYYGPQLNAQGKIVWSGGPAGSQEIFLYTISTGLTEQLTTNAYRDDFPRINGSGQVAWSAYEPGDSEVYLLTPGNPVPVNVSNNDVSDSNIKLNDRGQLIWTSGAAGSKQVYLFSGGITTNISANATDNLYPVFNNSGQVVWARDDGAAYQIVAYSDGVTTAITSGPGDKSSPSINLRGDICWLGYDGAHWQVYQYSDAVTYQVSHSAYDVYDYSTPGDSRVVWAEFNGRDWDIFRAAPTSVFYDAVAVTDGSDNAYGPSFGGGYVAWKEYDGSHYQVHLYYGGGPDQGMVISTNGLDNDEPVVNNHGQVVWSGFDGAYWQVYFYDQGVTTQLTYNSFDSGHSSYTINSGTRYHPPSINNAGQIIFAGGPAGNKDVYLYDLAWGNLMPQRISPDDGITDDYHFINAAGQVVWQHGASPSREIYYYDGVAVSNLTQTATDESRTRIADNGDIVWIGYDGADWDIYLRRAGSAVNENLSTANGYEDNWPRLSNNGQVVWMGWDGHDWEIYRYDGSLHQLTDNQVDDAYPRINNDGQVVWQGYNGHDWDIYLYDHGLTSQISTNAGNDFLPRINNVGQINWEGLSAAGVSQVYYAFASVASRAVYQVSNTPSLEEKSPDLNNIGVTVWAGWDGSDWEIFANAGGSTVQITNNTVDDENPRINDAGELVWETWNAGVSQVYYHHLGDPIVGPWLDQAGSPDINDMGQIVYLKGDGLGNTQLYCYTAGVHELIATFQEDGYYGTEPRLNNAGAVVWHAFDGHDDEILFYNPVSHTVTQLTNNDATDLDPQINDHGQVAWGRDDGTGWQVYQMSAGVVTQVTTGPYLAGKPVINEQGRIAYLSLDGHDLELYIRNTSGLDMRLTSNSWDDTSPAMVSEHGTVAFAQYLSATNDEIFTSTVMLSEGARYHFTFHYADGDYYQGVVYAGPEYLYDLGSRRFAVDEHALEGYYEITAVDYLQTNPRSGQVLVSAYYDHETGLTYTPLEAGTVMGTAFLGTEAGYIVSDADVQYRFGYDAGTFYEGDDPPAPVETAQFDFVHHYADGDYAWGRVYAAPEFGYYNSYRQAAGGGYYEIVNVTADFGPELAGQVFVDGYCDQDSAWRYTPINADQPMGFSYLGSEAGAIIDAGVAAFHFDQLASANAANAYTYVFHYSGGDYYYGTLYGHANSGYYEGYQLIPPVTIEGGQSGYYELVAVTYGVDPALMGQVTVAAYADADGGGRFSTLGTDLFVTPGAGFLGSETGYIVSDGDLTAFFGWYGGDYLEADVPPPVTATRYDFVFHYPGGDYYLGWMYARDGMGYYNGYRENQPLAEGSGYYEIINAVPGFDAALDGQVFVNLYCDTASGWRYPTLDADLPAGEGWLGSEAGAIQDAAVTAFHFGYDPAGFREASAINCYTYVFHYGGGDYYYGAVYGGSAQGYYAGYQQAALGVEDGQGGSYELVAVSYGVDPALTGQVTVAAYADADGGLRYSSLATDLFVTPGVGGLGSEAGYIVSAADAAAAFGWSGGTLWEADVPSAPVTASRFDFVFHYPGGDYYLGWFYASGGYSDGFWQLQPLPGGIPGYYEIIHATPGFDAALAGQVFVDRYFDAASGWRYPVLNADLPAGAGGLGSEAGAILDAALPAFGFGFDPAGFREADAVNRYTYVFTYSGGDYYYGTVYGGTAQDYHEGYRALAPAPVEGGQIGIYELVAVTYGFDSATSGQVTVEGYVDVASQASYTAVAANLFSLPGFTHLGSESGYLFSPTNSDWFFGLGLLGDAPCFFEADWLQP